MNVLVIGATGYIGKAATKALSRADHDVHGLARRGSEKKLDHDAIPAIGDITDPETCVRAAAKADAVLYAVQYNGSDQFEVESAVLNALVKELSAKKKTFIYTSGVWIYGSSPSPATEETAVNPIPLVAKRPAVERIVLDAVATGLRGIVIRPTSVYGNGAGIPAMWAQSARDEGATRIVGDGSNHYPVLHVDDLAELFVLALDKAAPGAVYNAADTTHFTLRQFAEAASRGQGKKGAVNVWPLEDARKAMGPFAEALALDQTIDSQKARRELDWSTRGTTLVDDLQTGSYAQK